MRAPLSIQRDDQLLDNRNWVLIIFVSSPMLSTMYRMLYIFSKHKIFNKVRTNPEAKWPQVKDTINKAQTEILSPMLGTRRSFLGSTADGIILDNSMLMMHNPSPRSWLNSGMQFPI